MDSYEFMYLDLYIYVIFSNICSLQPMSQKHFHLSKVYFKNFVNLHCQYINYVTVYPTKTDSSGEGMDISPLIVKIGLGLNG